MNRDILAKLYLDLNDEDDDDLYFCLQKCKDTRDYTSFQTKFPDMYDHYKPLVVHEFAGKAFYVKRTELDDDDDDDVTPFNFMDKCEEEDMIYGMKASEIMMGNKQYGVQSRVVLVDNELPITESIERAHSAVLVASVGRTVVNNGVTVTKTIIANAALAEKLNVDIDYTKVVSQIVYVPTTSRKDAIDVASKIYKDKTFDVPYDTIRSPWYEQQYKKKLKQLARTDGDISDFFTVKIKKRKGRTGKSVETKMYIPGKKRIVHKIDDMMDASSMFKYLEVSRTLRGENEVSLSGTSASYRYPFFMSKQYVDMLDKLNMYDQVRKLHLDDEIGIIGLTFFELRFFLTNTGDDLVAFRDEMPVGFTSKTKRTFTMFTGGTVSVILDFTCDTILYKKDTTHDARQVLYERTIAEFQERYSRIHYYKSFEHRHYPKGFLRYRSEHQGIIVICSQPLDNVPVAFNLFKKYVITINNFRNCYQLYRCDLIQYFTMLKDDELIDLVPPFSFRLIKPVPIPKSTKKVPYKQQDIAVDYDEDYLSSDLNKLLPSLEVNKNSKHKSASSSSSHDVSSARESKVSSSRQESSSSSAHKRHSKSKKKEKSSKHKSKKIPTNKVDMSSIT